MANQALLFFKAESRSETSSKESYDRKIGCTASTVFEGFTLVNSFWQQDKSISFLRPVLGAGKINFLPGSNLKMVEVSFSQSTIRQTFGNATSIRRLDCPPELEHRLHVDKNNLNTVKGLFKDNSRIKFDTDYTNMGADLVLCGDNISVIEKLLQSGVNISYQNGENGSLAHYAARRSSISLIHVLQRCRVDLNAVGNDGLTPLHIAVQKKNLEVLRVLLDNGANPNILTADGHSPLYLAVDAGFSDAVVFLMERGANANAVDKEKHVLLKHFSSLASEVDDSKIIETLLRVGFDYDSIATLPAVLINAVERKDFGLAQKLLRHGACPHQKHRRKKPYKYWIFPVLAINVFETTAIHVACASGDEKMVELLLDHGADTNVVCEPESFDSLIKIAIKINNSKIVSLLVMNGANVYDCADIFKLAHVYGRRPYDVMTSLLKNSFCDVNVDHDGVKPILYSYGQEKEKFKIMMKHGGFLQFHDLVSAIRQGGDSERHEDIEYLDVFFACCFTDLKESDETRAVHELLEEADLHYSEADLYDGIPDHPPRKVPAGMLAKHLVKLSVAGKQINEKLIMFGREIQILKKVIPAEYNHHFDLDALRAECEGETDLMKKKVVYEPSISLYDVLTKDTRIVSRYLKNDNIRLMLRNYNFMKEFPKYGLIIKYRVRQAEWRREFLIGGMKAFNWLVVRLPRLPLELKENILDLLSIQDLIKLKLCFPSK